MKKILLLIGMIPLLSYAESGTKGNGADPYKFISKDFPIPAKIEKAIELIEVKLDEVTLPEELKLKVREELHSLYKDNKFRYLGNTIILPGTGYQYGHEVPSEDGEFLGLGAFTLPEVGAMIHLTERTLQYDESHFAEIILHETFHHILSVFLRTDELFTEKITKEIWQNGISNFTTKSLTLGYYIPKEKITKTRFIQALSLQIYKNKSLYDSWMLHVMPCHEYLNQLRSEFINNCFNTLVRLTSSLDEDLSEISVTSLTSFDGFGDYSLAHWWNSFFLLRIFEDQGHQLVKMENDFDTFCVGYRGYWIFKECLNDRKVKELIFEQKK